ncbi:hypothetical protein [Corynebacterium deserti]|nr:hypothetical protein [Corynebacterium deserti]
MSGILEGQDAPQDVDAEAERAADDWQIRIKIKEGVDVMHDEFS